MVIPRGECVGAEPPFLDVADGAVINDQTLPVDPLGCMYGTMLLKSYDFICLYNNLFKITNMH